MPYRKQKINNIYISSRPKWKENTSAELLNYCYTISMTKSNCKSIQSILSTYYDIYIVHYPSCVYAMTNQCFFFFLSSISPAELYQSIYLSYIWQPDLICLYVHLLEARWNVAWQSTIVTQITSFLLIQASPSAAACLTWLLPFTRYLHDCHSIYVS